VNARFQYDPRDAVAQLRANDPVLRLVMDRVGPFSLQLTEAGSLFAALLRSIVYQQLHGKAAQAIHARVLALLAPLGGPTPAACQHASDEALRAAGLSRGKLRAIRDLTVHCLAGTVPPLREAQRMADAELEQRLTQVRGIGPWTVHMLQLFYLGRPDILPTGDFAIRLAFKQLYQKRQDPSPAVITRHARCWQPFRSVASWYLWRSLDSL